MKTLGEQWEEIRKDGNHMFRAVEGMDCEGCAFGFCGNEFGEEFGCTA